MHCHIFHLVGNTSRQDWKAPLNLPVSTINSDAIQRREPQRCKNDFEYALMHIGVPLTLGLICFGGPGEFGGDRQWCKKENCHYSRAVVPG